MLLAVDERSKLRVRKVVMSEKGLGFFASLCVFA